ncbi:hypothetical protein PENSPDRAFT_651418 [Peniophora sp. CONT]|nr:hypothetical protein PENSPDRAFT_651418 [Peniophora sp. CONT]
MLLQLLRIPLIAVVWLSFRIATTPPRPGPRREEQARAPEGRSIRLMRATLRPATLVRDSIISAVLLADSIFTLVLCTPLTARSSAFLFSMLTQFKDQSVIDIPAVTITPLFLVGVLLVTVGTYVRTRCFNELGRLFTFDLALRDRHELVTTGPYSIVRHPAYPARFVVLLGASICTFGAGSWWKETGQGRTVAGELVLAAWAAVIARDIVVLLFVMVPKEEKMLRKAFGKQWLDYAAQTPYKMILGVW